MVLDTNVVSELMRSEPDPAVLRWVESHAGHLRTTAITVAEIHYGIRRLAAGRRRDMLTAAAAEIFGGFASDILPFDHTAAAVYGEIVAANERAGAPISVLDAQIASICRAAGHPLATRNTRDFSGTGIELVNPWE